MVAHVVLRTAPGHRGTPHAARSTQVNQDTPGRRKTQARDRGAETAGTRRGVARRGNSATARSTEPQTPFRSATVYIRPRGVRIGHNKFHFQLPQCTLSVPPAPGAAPGAAC